MKQPAPADPHLRCLVSFSGATQISARLFPSVFPSFEVLQQGGERTGRYRGGECTAGEARRHGKKPPVGPPFGDVAAHTIPAAPATTVIHPERPVVRIGDLAVVEGPKTRELEIKGLGST